MNRDLAMKVANSVLYEGYMLYPYRPSALKNQQRWSFGILYPPAYGEVGQGTERSQMHSECLLRPTGEQVSLQIEVRFLQLVTRDGAHPAEKQESDEPIERSSKLEMTFTDSLERTFPFRFPSLDKEEPSRGQTAENVGEFRCEQHELKGVVSCRAEALQEGLIKLTIDVSNATELPAGVRDRDSVLKWSLLSVHTILTTKEGQFISLLDPPQDVREAVAQCNNIGNFPVLVGNDGERDMVLCSPIILYDYPQIAPESAGDFCDATEIDEMLTLRVMTLTDQEKDEMRVSDEYMRNLLQRTEESAREQLMRTHGTIRSMGTINETK